MRFSECEEEGIVSKITPDDRRARSLKRMCDDRMKYLEKQDINELNCNFIFEQYYSALIELIHSIASKRGYKILNHLCVASFLDEILGKPDVARKFNIFRKIRNNLVYYGKRVQYDSISKRIEEIKKVIKNVKDFNPAS